MYKLSTVLLYDFIAGHIHSSMYVVATGTITPLFDQSFVPTKLQRFCQRMHVPTNTTYRDSNVRMSTWPHRRHDVDKLTTANLIFTLE